MMTVIKKKFFNGQKTDIYQECEKALELTEKKEVETEKEQVEEYVNNYNVTTRWQTV